MQRSLETLVNLEVSALNACYLESARCPPWGFQGSKITAVNAGLDEWDGMLDSLSELVYGCVKKSTLNASQGCSTVVVPTVASKVAFPEQLRGFNVSPCLSGAFRVASESPNSLLKAAAPEIPRCPITTARTELWYLLHRWDKVGRLLLALEHETSPAHASNLFCLQKPDGELRQIIDRRPRNAVERGPPDDAPKMGHVSSLLGIVTDSGSYPWMS